MAAQVALLDDGRLHLHHGPIDLLIAADGARSQAFDAAISRFETVLEELVAELPRLRRSNGNAIKGRIAKRMAAAVHPHEKASFITPMAAVAGAVADEILKVMLKAAPLRRAYVNNGGDIALWVAPNEQFEVAIASGMNAPLGKVLINANGGVGGIATSGRGGRSLSLGIADSVTVLAKSASAADAAATMIANAVDLPGHASIKRAPACDLDPDSDLGNRLVTTGCLPLPITACDTALNGGVAAAQGMITRGIIHSAALFLQGHSRIVGQFPVDQLTKETLAHA